MYYKAGAIVCKLGSREYRPVRQSQNLPALRTAVKLAASQEAWQSLDLMTRQTSLDLMTVGGTNVGWGFYPLANAVKLGH